MYSGHLMYPLLLPALIYNTHTHVSLYMPHTLHAPTYPAMLRTIYPYVACATHHSPHFPAYPIHPAIHTHSHTHPVLTLAVLSDTFSSLVAHHQSTD